MSDKQKSQLFGEIAIALGYITSEDIQKALETQFAGEPWGIGFILMRLGKLTLEQIEEILTYQDISFINVDEEIEPEEYEQQRLGEIAVSAKAIKYSDLLHALEQKARMKELDGTEPKLGKVLVDLNLITEDQLKNLLSKGGINVYQCQRCNRIYNVKRFSTREFCCPFCHYRDQMSYESDVLNIEGRLQIGNFKSIKSRLKETQKFIIEHNLGKINRYEILEEIGIGRMGVVSKVKEEKTGKIYALKAFIIDNEYKEYTLSYFEHHFTKYQHLTHNNIAKVLEFDRFENLVYAVFEYTDGIPFDLWLLREGADVRKRIEILKEIAHTLAFAHENNVYHLNLHPGNIFVDKDGKIKITDFALPAPLIDSSIENPVFGMRKYLAPENFRQDVGSLESKTDQFAFGCLAYETITSNPPFSGILLSETQSQLEKGLPASIESRHLLPYKDFENVIFKCLEPKNAARYINMYDVVDDITDVLKGEKPRAGAILRSRRFYQKYGKLAKFSLIPIAIVLILLLIQFVFRDKGKTVDEEIPKVTVDLQLQLIDQAKTEFSQKNYSKVDDLIKKMDEETQQEPEVMSLRLKLDALESNYEKVLSDYSRNKDLSRDLDNVFIAVNSAKEQAKYELATDILEDSYEYHRDNEKIYPELMLMLTKLSRWEKLLDVGEYALSTLDVKQNYFAYSCLAAGKLKKWNKSQTYFMQALASSTDKSLAYYFRALVNFDRLGNSVKQNLRILDNVQRDTKKAQSLNSRISGNAHFMKRVNQEIVKIQYRILSSKYNLKETRDSGILIDAADLLVNLYDFKQAQAYLARVNIAEVSSKKLLEAVNSYYVCKNYDQVLKLLKIVEQRQNLLLNDYLLRIRTQFAQEKYVQAYITSQKALRKYPDNYELMYESSKAQIKINPQNVTESYLEKLSANSLYTTKNLYLQALKLDEQNQFASEKEILIKLLEKANPQNDSEIYDESARKLLNIVLHSNQEISKADVKGFIEYLKYSQNSGLLTAQLMKQVFRTGNSEMADYLLTLAKLELTGEQEFEQEIKLLDNIYKFKHAEILTRLAKGENLEGIVVDSEDLMFVVELNDRQDVKEAVLKNIAQNIDKAWVDKSLVFQNINNLLDTSKLSIDVISNVISSNSGENLELNNIYKSKRLTSDYFTFIKAWGTENLNAKLQNHMQNGKVFECINYLEKYKSQRPQKEIIEKHMKLWNILGYTQETMRELILYKETFLIEPEVSMIEDFVLYAIRERNDENYKFGLNQISSEKQKLFNMLKEFLQYPERRDLLFDNLYTKIVSVADNADVVTAKVIQVFVNKAIEYGYFQKLKEHLNDLTGLTYGLDGNFIYFLENTETGLMQNLQPSFEQVNLEEIETRNQLILNAVELRSAGIKIISDYLLNEMMTTSINDRAILYLQSLYDETTEKFNNYGNTGAISKIKTFLSFIDEPTSKIPEISEFSVNFNRILQLIRADKLIENNQVELADAILQSFEDISIFDDIVSFLKKKIHYIKREFNLSAQITPKKSYVGLKSLQILSELQSDDIRIFQIGIEKLISDSSIDSSLLFDCAGILFLSPFKLTADQIDSIFKQRRIELNRDPKVLLSQAILLKSIDMNTEAEDIFTDLMRFHPQNSEVYDVAIKLSLIENDFVKAKSIIDQAKSNKVRNNKLTEYEILLHILNEQYALALDKALPLIDEELYSTPKAVIQYLLYLSTKLPPSTQKIVFDKIYNLVPNDKNTNELVLINAFMLDDIALISEVAERLYQNAIEKTKYAKWIIWALCRQGEYEDALALAEIYSSKNDPWIDGVLKYCKIMSHDITNLVIDETKRYLEEQVVNSVNPELMLWGSLIAQRIFETQLAQRLKSEGTDLMPNNPSGIYNLIIDRINASRFKDAETLVKQVSKSFTNWLPFDLERILIAGKTGMSIAEIAGLREMLRSTTNINVYRMTYWLFKDMIDKNVSVEKDFEWLEGQIAKGNAAIMKNRADDKAEVYALTGIIAFKLGKYKQAQELWAKSGETSDKFDFLTSYSEAIKNSYKSLN